MGRPRKPTRIKELAGTLQKCRTNPAEPVLRAGRPAAPGWLSPAAAAIFEATCDDMARRQTLAVEWRDVIADYSIAEADVHTCSAILAAEGETFMAGGQIRPRPEVAQRSVAATLAHRLRAELGLGPVAAGKTG
ncbi:MAG: hypothetical protein EPN45_20355 [Rhizobiaceae bacterium]|nr:MAG: hypothetical protein EPN45_20355 [Rhizobiaceae bacterium]